MASHQRYNRMMLNKTLFKDWLYTLVHMRTSYLLVRMELCLLRVLVVPVPSMVTYHRLEAPEYALALHPLPSS